ncbi:Vmc-like lipoprotein signal peptide domain-containing protein [uncultured Solobacterium sp.]
MCVRCLIYTILFQPISPVTTISTITVVVSCRPTCIVR